MDASNLVARLLTRRGTVGMAVIGAHAGLVLLLLHSVIAQPVTTTPIVVSVIQAPARLTEAPPLFHPELLPPRPILVPPPEYAAINEPSTTVTAAVAPAREDSPPPSWGTSTPAELPAMSDVAYLQRPIPRYPPQSRRAREEGLVILRVVIDHTGRVVSVDVQRSSGHPRLDEAACNAVAAALFKPYVADGVARPASAVIPIEFSLRPASS